MCGIAGLWSERIEAGERARLVRRMVARLAHRGPSGSAEWSGPGVSLGLARLAIVAPGTPARALEGSTRDVVAVVNGEIYNHAELRAQLRARGHQVADHPDTAVLPHLYESDGIAFPQRLDGMFAAAIWDGRARRLILARDRAGEKPLFYCAAPEGFAFASEPGALASLPWLSRDPSPGALSRYLVHGFFAGEDCAFDAIRQLPPATVLEWSLGGERTTRYWRPWDGLGGAPTIAAADAPAATLAALQRAVADRVPGDVPFGVFLSGGVDSGMVASLAARATRHRFPTFCLRLPDRGYDESSYAREVSESIGSEHHELVMDPGAGEEAMVLFAREMDQPLGDPSVLPTWALARLAARHVPVVLSGEGGDELFAGYPTYLGHRHARLASALPAPVRSLLLAAIRRMRPRHHHVTIGHLVERFLLSAGMPPFERHAAWFGTASREEALAFLAPDLRRRAGADAPFRHLRRVEHDLENAGAGDVCRDPETVAYQLLDFELYLSGDLLTKVDRCSMAHGLESRAPFLQHGLIEMALALPEDARLRGVESKWALKQAAKGILPPSVLGRRKQGFSPPFSSWARGPLRAMLLERLSRERVERAGVLDPGATTRLLEKHLQAGVDRGRTLWTLLSLQMWAERWGPAASIENEDEAALARNGSGDETIGLRPTAPEPAATRDWTVARADSR